MDRPIAPDKSCTGCDPPTHPVQMHGAYRSWDREYGANQSLAVWGVGRQLRMDARRPDQKISLRNKPTTLRSVVGYCMNCVRYRQSLLNFIAISDCLVFPALDHQALLQRQRKQILINHSEHIVLILRCEFAESKQCSDGGRPVYLHHFIALKQILFPDEFQPETRTFRPTNQSVCSHHSTQVLPAFKAFTSIDDFERRSSTRRLHLCFPGTFMPRPGCRSDRTLACI